VQRIRRRETGQKLDPSRRVASEGRASHLFRARKSAYADRGTSRVAISGR